MERRHFKRVLGALVEGAKAPEVPKTLERDADQLREESLPWLTASGVQGVGISERVTQGRPLRELALKVYVERKLPEDRVEGERIPPRIRIPGSDLVVETDVEEIGPISLEALTNRGRPARPGFSVNHPNCGRGTLGCLVRKRGQPESLYILSNAHVIGDFGVAAANDPVYQPSTEDEPATEENIIGRFEESIQFLFSDEGFPNLADAAIARVSPDSVDPDIHLLGLPVGVNFFPQRGMLVQKVGCKSGHSQGLVRDIDFVMSSTFKRPGGGFGRVGFRQQVLCSQFTSPGDSGAVILTRARKVVGLHFAGTPSTSIFSRIGPVLQALDIEILTAEASP